MPILRRFYQDGLVDKARRVQYDSGEWKAILSTPILARFNGAVLHVYKDFT